MRHNITELTEFVNLQLVFHESQSKRKQFKGEPSNASKKHDLAVSHFKSLLKILEEDSSDISIEEGDDLFSISATDIQEMPQELKDVLNLQETDILESQVVELLGIAGRALNLKELIMGLYRKYDHTVKERNPFASKLYRMKDSGLIVSPKKGHYALPETSDDDFLDELMK